jgi:uncharacterized protein
LQILQTNLSDIKQLAAEKENENDAFRYFLKNKNSGEVDAAVHKLNEDIAQQIDCTQCGNCCRSLMINITSEEATELAGQLKMKLTELKKKYIEESQQGQLILNTIPCHFLSGTKCSIYQSRFTECRDFPHLHKQNFTDRLFGTMQYYSMCPIIFNVVEKLKARLGFITDKSFPG